MKTASSAAHPTRGAAPSANSPSPSSQASLSSVAACLAQALSELGVCAAFGTNGPPVAPFAQALARSGFPLLPCRHEAGATFAAIEAWCATGRPSVVFTSAGPGFTNALTGAEAAWWEGAKLLLVSGLGAGERMEPGGSSGVTPRAPSDSGRGARFDLAQTVTSANELPELLETLAQGFARPGRFIVHLRLPLAVQNERLAELRSSPRSGRSLPPSQPVLERCAQELASEPFAIWLGFGARHAATRVRAFAERSGAPVLCSPRARGIVSESHPAFLGVSGPLGDPQTVARLRALNPSRILVLGSRLSELTAGAPAFVPPRGFVHVDVDPEAPGAALAEAPCLRVHAEVSAFLEALHDAWPDGHMRHAQRAEPLEPEPVQLPRAQGAVRVSALARAIQRVFIDGTDTLVMTEAEGAPAPCSREFSFEEPGRFRIVSAFGSSGHATAGVVGAAFARREKALAVVGASSMLVNTELRTAVQHRVPAIWVVLSEAGSAADSRPGVEGPRIDFVNLARAVGADGIRIERETQLEAALAVALVAEGPYVVEVQVEPGE